MIESVRTRLGHRLTNALGLTRESSDNSMFDASYSRFAKTRLWAEKTRSLATIYYVKLQEANDAAKDLADHIVTLLSDENIYSTGTGVRNSEESKSSGETHTRNVLSIFQKNSHEMCFGFGSNLVEGLKSTLIDQLNEWDLHLQGLDIHLEEHEEAHEKFDLENQQVESLTSRLSTLSADDPNHMALNQELSGALEQLSEANRRYLTATQTSCTAMDQFVVERRALVLPMVVKLAHGIRLLYAQGHMLMGEFLDKSGCNPLEAFGLTPKMGMERPKLLEGRIYRRGRLLAHPMFARILGNTLEMFSNEEDMDRGQLPTILCDVPKMVVERKGARSASWDRYGLCKGVILLSGPAQQINLGFSGFPELNQWYRALMSAKSWDPTQALAKASSKFSRLAQFIQTSVSSQYQYLPRVDRQQSTSTVYHDAWDNQSRASFGDDVFLDSMEQFSTPINSDEEEESSSTKTGTTWEDIIGMLEGGKSLSSSPIHSTVFEELLQVCGKKDRLLFEDLMRWEELKEVLKAGVLSEQDVKEMWDRALGSTELNQESTNAEECVEADKRTGGFAEFSEFLVLFIEKQIQLEIDMALDNIDENLQHHRRSSSISMRRTKAR